MGADFVVPFIEQVKPCSIGAWLCCVFSSNSVTRYHRQKCVKSSCGTGNCCSTLDWCLVYGFSLNFYELGLSKSLYYSKAPGAYFMLVFTALLGCMSVQRLQSNSTVCCLGDQGPWTGTTAFHNLLNCFHNSGHILLTMSPKSICSFCDLFLVSTEALLLHISL